MKRVLSVALALVMMLGVMGLFAQPAAATTPEETIPETMTVSDDLIALLKFEEGFCRYPVWDYSQWTVGYGTRCPDDKLAEYQRNGITDAQAEQLLRNHLTNTEYLINTYLIKKYDLTMTQGQFDALVMFSYNMGGGWITSPSQKIHQAVVSGATDNTFVDALSSWCKAGGQVKTFLLRRRLSEAYMYQEGFYQHTPPDYYCYVTYNGNGGSISQSAQGYNTNMPATPSSVATHSDYTFAGWYTSPTGGEKVETLEQVHDTMTLYAHWQELTYEEPELFDEPVKITVTTDDVNLRKGPGTNYAITGTANTGDTFEIWQVMQGGSYLWGYYKAGWICLQYTDYEQVISGKENEPEISEPEETEPEETEPEETEPEATEPEATEPEVTEPEITEPEVTEPEVTQPAKKVTGVVTNGYLKVRQGPGTGYATVDTLPSGTRVEILEQKTGGSMVWGRISNGWISMTYVILDEEDFESEADRNESKPTGQTGRVTCEQLNVRDGAGITYNIVGTYYKNDTVTITEQKTVGSTTWGKTAKGWVSMDYISLGNSGSSDNQGGTSAQLEGTVTGSDDLRIRTGPGVTYAVAGFLAPGTKVTILEQKTVDSVNWGRIDKGWVSMDYISLSGQGSSGNSGGQTGGTSQVTGKVNSELRIRSGAGTTYEVVGLLPAGSKITILEQKTVGSTVWGRTDRGWISMDYVTLTTDTAPEEDTNQSQTTGIRTVTAACLCVRSGAGTGNTVVSYLYKDAKVTVTEIKTVAGEQWGKISTGWICLTYTA